MTLQDTATHCVTPRSELTIMDGDKNADGGWTVPTGRTNASSLGKNPAHPGN